MDRGTFAATHLSETKAAATTLLDEIAREKDRLPRGWGRFGKTLDRLSEICESDESVLSSCVGVNPSFKHTAVTAPFTLMEMAQSTNVILVATSRRILLLATGLAGGARDHHALDYEGLELADVQKKELTLRLPAGEIRVRGAAKQMLPGFVDTLADKGVSA